jgi:hypothetical protein
VGSFGHPVLEYGIPNSEKLPLMLGTVKGAICPMAPVAFNLPAQACPKGRRLI